MHILTRTTATVVMTALLTACAAGAERAAEAPEPSSPTPTDAAPATSATPEDVHEHEDDHEDEDDHEASEAATPADAPVPDGATERDVASPRLAVADGERGTVVLIDLGTGDEVDRLELPDPVRLTTASDGRHLLASAGGPGTVTAIDAGAWTVTHGMHAHHHTGPPAVHGTVEVPGVAHVIPHDGVTALFADDDGTVHLLDDDDLDATDLHAADVVPLEAAHHGVAVPLEDGLVATIPAADPEESLPVGVAVLDADGGQLAAFEECPGLHGEAATSTGMAFACEDGVLHVVPAGATSTSAHLPYPAPGRTGTLIAHDEVVYGPFADEGEDPGVLRLDVTTGEGAVTALPDAVGPLVALDDEAGVVAVTADGTAHLLDLDGAVQASTPAVTAWDPTAGHGTARPQAVAAEGLVWISDPATGEVVELSASDLTETRRLDVGGTPASMALTGLP